MSPILLAMTSQKLTSVQSKPCRNASFKMLLVFFKARWLCSRLKLLSRMLFVFIARDVQKNITNTWSELFLIIFHSYQARVPYKNGDFAIMCLAVMIYNRMMSKYQSVYEFHSYSAYQDFCLLWISSGPFKLYPIQFIHGHWVVIWLSNCLWNKVKHNTTLCFSCEWDMLLIIKQARYLVDPTSPLFIVCLGANIW